MSASFRRRAVLGLAATAAASLGIAPAVPAFAAARVAPGASMFQGGAGTAEWSNSMSKDDNGFSIELSVPDTSSYAGVEFNHISDSLPSTEPSFWFNETGTVSGGSPRLVIEDAAGCVATESSVETYSGWMFADHWDLQGPCGYVYNAGWDGVGAAFGTSPVTSAYVVSDSYTGGHVDYIDDLSYGGVTLSQPKDNGNH